MPREPHSADALMMLVETMEPEATLTLSVGELREMVHYVSLLVSTRIMERAQAMAERADRQGDDSDH
jgi:hypothetical protein